MILVYLIITNKSYMNNFANSSSIKFIKFYINKS